MIIPIPLFIGRLFDKSDRDREIETHCEMVNIRLSLIKEAEDSFDKLYNKLSESAKKKFEKVWAKSIIATIPFPSQNCYIDARRHFLEENFAVSLEGGTKDE